MVVLCRRADGTPSLLGPPYTAEEEYAFYKATGSIVAVLHAAPPPTTAPSPPAKKSSLPEEPS